MPANKVVIDTNLLVLLIVGSVDEKRVGTKRTKEFTRQHYLGLLRFLEDMDTVYVTPNVLTETSNLLQGLGDPRLMERLRRLVEQSREIPIESKIAVRHKKFPQVGLADAALLEVISAKKPLLTTDFALFGIACAKEEGAAFNFWHLAASW